MEDISAGHYHRKQLGCDCGVIAWSHRSRFRLALRLIGSEVNRLLDYGSGDGTLLAMAAPRLREGWGADLAVDQIIDCRARFAGYPNLRFLTIPELGGSELGASFDVVTCMETLEHCTPPIVEVVLRDLARLVSPQGRVLISVPIEIGLSFFVKSIVRKVAGWRGLSDYRYYERYTRRNAMRMLFAGQTTAIKRPVYGEPGAEYYSHYGFNWKALRERVRAHLHVERTHFSPLGFLGGVVGSQAWFVCRPRVSSAS